MATFRINFLTELAKPYVDLTCDNITLRGGTFVGLNKQVIAAIFTADQVSYIQRLDPAPAAPQELNVYRLTWRSADRAPEPFAALGIHIDETGDWITGWDSVATLGFLRASNLDSAVLLRSPAAPAPTVVIETPPATTETTA